MPIGIYKRSKKLGSIISKRNKLAYREFRPLEVYALKDANGVVCYVGYGRKDRRAYDHLRPGRWRYTWNLKNRPEIFKKREVKNRLEALSIESRWIKKYSPYLNQSIYAGAGGIRPWNKGLPRELQPRYGKKVSRSTRLKISKSNKGKRGWNTNKKCPNISDGKRRWWASLSIKERRKITRPGCLAAKRNSKLRKQKCVIK